VPKGHVSLEERLQGKRVCVCVGAGGVGKTTVSAALALGLAMRGQRAVVVSIDPARRLATALGLKGLENEPHKVDCRALGEQGMEMPGELWAMMLDSKGTFDGLIERLAPDERSREEVLSNRIYRELSGATAGSQEFTAVAKLFELDRDERFDVLVLDTPPSRNALDFLDAPDRLRNFLEGRALRMLLPGGLAGGLLGRGTGLVFALLSRATGVNLMGELTSFFGSLSHLGDGLAERARGVERLLRDRATCFVLVSSPEPERAEEALFLAERLRTGGMEIGALVVNRAHEIGLEGRDPAEVRAVLSRALDDEQLASKLADNLVDFDVLCSRDEATVAELVEKLEARDPVVIGQLDGDVQDLAGLALIVDRLFA
jgi:anion-transporting  ArsA/GET3 family ATPase